MGNRLIFHTITLKISSTAISCHLFKEHAILNDLINACTVHTFSHNLYVCCSIIKVELNLSQIIFHFVFLISPSLWNLQFTGTVP